MRTYRMPKTVEIVYFTGTGGTKKAAELFVREFTAKGIEVYLHEINYKSAYKYHQVDLFLILYPVYALNAPRPVSDFIKKLPINKHIPAAILSVSGGGEITPNTASRLHCIRHLEKKGYNVVYESMLIMPSNLVLQTPDELSIRLIKILPLKVEHIVHGLLSGVKLRTNPNPLDQFLSFLGEAEKYFTPILGKLLYTNKNCTGCGLCSSACPSGNIVLKNGTPAFDMKCNLCLKCIYGCPKKALQLHIIKFIVLKKGYNLNNLYKKAAEENSPRKISNHYGYAYSGIVKYLSEK